MRPLHRKVMMLGGAAVLSTVVLFHMATMMLPNNNGFVGTDYRYVLPYMLAGYEWVRQNGLFTIPYFTPDFCGGIPWLANPISFFYSLPQFLTFILVDPVEAAKWSLLFYATVGGASTYLLLRRCFATSWQAAGLGFVLFQLNGFLLFRAAIGHLIFNVYGLVPALCLCVLVNQEREHPLSRLTALTAILAGACCLAVMVYAGAPSYVIPAVLNVGGIVMLHQTRSGVVRRPWLILVGSCLWSIPLSALKLLPAFIFVSHYPRPYIGEYQFDNPFILARTLLQSLFLPESEPLFTMTKMVTSGLGSHEIDFGVSVVPFFLIVGWLLLCRHPHRMPGHPIAWAGLVLICAIPVLGTFGGEAWTKILLHTPIINNNTVLARWWSIYILMLIVAAALAFDRLFLRETMRAIAFGVCVLVAAVQLELRDLTFYTTGIAFTLYDPRPVANAIRQIRTDRNWLPRIGSVGSATILAPLPEGVSPGMNDGVLEGISALPCYEPIFGYHLELFPARGLARATLDQAPPGFMNLADPRCYLTPGLAGCRPGDQFRAADEADLIAFVSHKALAWKQPSWQFASWLTTITSLVLTIGLLVVFGVNCARSHLRRPRLR